MLSKRSFCKDCPYMSLEVIAEKGDGEMVYRCVHFNLCTRLWELLRLKQK